MILSLKFPRLTCTQNVTSWNPAHFQHVSEGKLERIQGKQKIRKRTDLENETERIDIKSGISRARKAEKKYIFVIVHVQSSIPERQKPNLKEFFTSL